VLLSLEQLRAKLRQREIAPVYVLYGAETYLRDIAAKTIADFSFKDGDLRDFNQAEFSLSIEGNLSSALAAAEQLPLMADHRVVRITDVRVGATANRDTLKEGDEAMLNAYLENPSPSAVVIFIADELNGVRRMSKALRDKASAVEFLPLTDADLAKWARGKITELGATIDDGALRHLVALVGPDVRRLTNEVEKISTAALPDGVITFDLIDSLVPNQREVSNFDLTDHLLAGRRSQALKTLKKILDDGAEPLALLGLISYNFRRLLMAKEMMSHGADRTEVAKVVKLRYTDQEPFLTAARRSNDAVLTRAITRIADIDLAIKTSVGGGGPQGARMQLEMLVCELAAA
jgi:DNA polymerase-3 subunit delta